PGRDGAARAAAAGRTPDADIDRAGTDAGTRAARGDRIAAIAAASADRLRDDRGRELARGNDPVARGDQVDRAAGTGARAAAANANIDAGRAAARGGYAGRDAAAAIAAAAADRLRQQAD